MVRRSTACNECRKHRRKCVRSSLHGICDRCKYYDQACSFPGASNSESDSNDDIEQLTQEVKDLNLIISRLEAEMKMLNIQEQTQVTRPLCINNQWNITIHNGQFRIETGIRNISDLLQCQPIRYLSPRLSSDQTNQDLVVHFNIGQTTRLRLISTKLLTRCLKTIQEPNALLLPTSFLFNSNDIINQLVDIYFSCYNIIRPYIHKPSFMKYYNNLDSPLSSLICLCICCIACVYPCEHSPCSSEDLRRMGDYFAGLAKYKVLDQFDSPEKRLENAIALNMLSEYFYTVLNISENLKMSSMGYQICQDLKPWYDRECKKLGIPSVECALFSRHYATMFDYSRLIDVIISKTENIAKVKYMEWKYLPDEPQQTIEAIKGQNFIYKLMSHPVLAKIRLYRHHINKDSIHTLKFTDIILVDDIIAEWWDKLPLQYRISESWTNTQQLKTNIDQSESPILLLFLAYFLSYTNDIYATLLTPNDGDVVLSIVQERAIERCLHCSQLGVYALHRLRNVESSCHYIFVANECLSHTLDVLSILSLSSNVTIRTEAKTMLKEVMIRIDDIKFMRGHRVDPLKSPLLAIDVPLFFFSKNIRVCSPYS
ncbi:hypothetical protein K501DRAFT_248567 [Backusella circina FSU 941]|nr:hypothetical protein K501DRAFT_248567 [Backusella circina FSU 941]